MRDPMTLWILAGCGILWLSYLLSQRPKVSLNSQSATLMLLRGGYRSWSISYSEGLQSQPDGTWKNLWRRPRFHHCDVRRLA
jgi:hypothetical protein